MGSHLSCCEIHPLHTHPVGESSPPSPVIQYSDAVQDKELMDRGKRVVSWHGCDTIRTVYSYGSYPRSSLGCPQSVAVVPRGHMMRTCPNNASHQSRSPAWGIIMFGASCIMLHVCVWSFTRITIGIINIILSGYCNASYQISNIASHEHRANYRSKRMSYSCKLLMYEKLSQSFTKFS